MATKDCDRAHCPHCNGICSCRNCWYQNVASNVWKCTSCGRIVTSTELPEPARCADTICGIGDHNLDTEYDDDSIEALMFADEIERWEEYWRQLSIAGQ